jgi:hypothetical protein
VVQERITGVDATIYKGDILAIDAESRNRGEERTMYSHEKFDEAISIQTEDLSTHGDGCARRDSKPTC